MAKYSYGIGSNLIVNRDYSTDAIHATVLHERQHWINHSILQLFHHLEGKMNAGPKLPALQEALQQHYTKTVNNLADIKDELLACLREDANAQRSTDFWKTELYANLRKKFDENQQADLTQLLGHIEQELTQADIIFHSPANRGLLVYQLIDIPLTKFHKRIHNIVKFYEKRVSELTNFIPDLKEERSIADPKLKKELEDLRLQITNIAHGVSDYWLKIRHYKTQQRALQEAKRELSKLKERYDSLLKSAKLLN